jgi:hypothetical protein
MSELSEEEQKKIMESPPKGTFAIIMIIGLVFAVAWMALFFGRFLAHGQVS